MATVRFNEDLCKGCRLCVEACPKGIVEINTAKLNAKGFNPAGVAAEKAGACIGCAFCATMCPDCVIEVSK